MSFILKELKNYLMQESAINEDQEIDEKTSLIESGVLDSFSVAKLMIFVEQKFDVKIEVEDLTEENISTLKNIEALILRKQKK